MARVTKTIPERHQEIIDTARILFAENGYDKTQIADIAKHMNVAQGLIYHYFKSKTELLYAVIDEMAKEKNKILGSTLESSGNTAYQKLNILLNFRLDSSCFGKLIPSIASDAAIFEYCSNKMTESATSVLIMLIKQGNTDGSWNCNQPKEAAQFILKGFRGFYDISGTSNDDDKKEVLLELVVRVLGETADNKKFFDQDN